MVFAARVIANSSRNHTTVHDTTTHDLNMSYMYFPRPLRFGTNHACSLQISIPSTHRTFNGSFTTKPHRSAFSFRKILHLPSETTSMSYLLSSTIRCCYNVGSRNAHTNRKYICIMDIICIVLVRTILITICILSSTAYSST
eukprot:453630_1